jgi:hypothetical protein
MVIGQTASVSCSGYLNLPEGFFLEIGWPPKKFCQTKSYQLYWRGKQIFIQTKKRLRSTGSLQPTVWTSLLHTNASFHILSNSLSTIVQSLEAIQSMLLIASLCKLQTRNQEWTNFPDIKKLPDTSRHYNADTKQVLYWGATILRDTVAGRVTWRPGICTPLQ